jgi:hypothetical protein
MFNRSKTARKNVPPELAEEQAKHQQRVQNRSQSLSEDAKHFALRMYQEQMQHVQDVLGGLDNIQYWRYVRQFDPKYMKELANLIPEILKDIKHRPQAYIPPQAPPKPQGGQGGPGGGAGAPPPPGGGGAPGLGAPAAASFNSKRTKTAALGWEAHVLDDGTVMIEKIQGK